MSVRPVRRSSVSDQSNVPVAILIICRSICVLKQWQLLKTDRPPEGSSSSSPCDLSLKLSGEICGFVFLDQLNRARGVEDVLCLVVSGALFAGRSC